MKSIENLSAQRWKFDVTTHTMVNTYHGITSKAHAKLRYIKKALVDAHKRRLNQPVIIFFGTCYPSPQDTNAKGGYQEKWPDSWFFFG